MEYKIYAYVIGMNIALTATHKSLSWLAPRTKSILDDKLCVTINYLLTLLEWAMGSRRRCVKDETET